MSNVRRCWFDRSKKTATYNCNDDANANNRHDSVDVSPPPGVLEACLINGPERLLEIVFEAGRGGRCTRLRRQRDEGAGYPDCEVSVTSH